MIIHPYIQPTSQILYQAKLSSCTANSQHYRACLSSDSTTQADDNILQLTCACDPAKAVTFAVRRAIASARSLPAPNPGAKLRRAPLAASCSRSNCRRACARACSCSKSIFHPKRKRKEKKSLSLSAITSGACSGDPELPKEDTVTDGVHVTHTPSVTEDVEAQHGLTRPVSLWQKRKSFSPQLIAHRGSKGSALIKSHMGQSVAQTLSAHGV